MMRSMLSLLLIFTFGCTSLKPISHRADEEAHIERRLQLLLEQSVRSMRVGTILALDQAFSTLSVAHDLKPLDPRVLDGFGSVAWRRGDRETAKWYFRKAIEKNPQYSRPYVHLALVALGNNDVKAASGLLNKAIRLNPLNHRARNNLAALSIDHHGLGLSELNTPYIDTLKVLALSDPSGPVISHNLELISAQQTEGPERAPED